MRNTLKTFYLALITISLISCATTEPENPHPASTGWKNSEPIILLHGLNGFARDNYDNFWYWGGRTNLEAELRAAGYDVRTASVGPLSSNWDRSCEFFAYLKGGTVDYGKEHSLKAEHIRYGRTYEGIYPEWGTIDPATGEIRKIHIIAHSMGGTTARMVAQLLSEGSEEERNASGEEISPLFKGHRDWIKSITTLSTPHDGSTLTYEMTSYRQRDLISSLAVDFLIKWDDDFLIHNDMNLDQWEWTQQRDEEDSLQYEMRIKDFLSRRDWEWTNKDFADFDLAPEGAWETNGWVEARPDIYYFSWATRITYENGRGENRPNPLISLPLIPLSEIISHYTGYRSSLIQIDESWLPNDGAANSRSMKGPTLNSRDVIENWNGLGTPPKGVWNYRGELYPMDHMQIIGMSPILSPPGNFPGLVEWYTEQAALLSGLP